MFCFEKIVAILAIAISVVSAGNYCECYTATAYMENPACPTFDPAGKCMELMCVSSTTTTIPATNLLCRRTPTVTSYLPCKTACRAGCSTELVTSTASTSCLASTPIPTGFATVTTTTTVFSSPKPTAPPAVSSSGGAISAQGGLVSSNSPCYTATTTTEDPCPAQSTCIAPACIYVTTVTVPPKRSDCPITPTVTAHKTCATTCVGGCGTWYETVTATTYTA